MKIFGILNITEDSFSDGGKYLAPGAALARARELVAMGADVLDIGAASSNPESMGVAPEVEIGRLAPVVAALRQDGVPVSIDSFAPQVQRWALDQGVAYLNDIQGFPDAALYAALAAAPCKLVVMHSVQERGRATRMRVPAAEIFDRIRRFFEVRIAALTAAGIARERLILDPGMGFFLGSDAEASLTTLRRLGDLKNCFGLPLLVSVSRKSFVRALSGRPPQRAGAASLAAEIFAVSKGAAYIRTHDPEALRDAFAVWKALDGPAPAA
ncbi:MAG TPA: dihydropteroate synthase [Rhizomicrobium sp.]|nr:dihydropteroate synthase [Rhizomicrobium sp.]